MYDKIVVGYDGSEASKRALEYAKINAKSANLGLVIAYVIEWSPFAFLTPDELEQRHKRRKEELAMAQEKIIDPVIAQLDGFETETVLRYGDIADTLAKVAKEANGAIVIGRQGHSRISDRIFGSAASKLVQISDVPVTIIP